MVKSMLIVFFGLTVFVISAQEQQVFWSKIAQLKASDSVSKVIFNLKKKAKKWNQKDEVYYYDALGKNQYDLRNFDSAVYYFNKGIQQAKILKLDSIHGKLLRQKGNACYYLKNKKNARQSLIDALSVADKHHFLQLKADVLTNLAILKIDEVSIIEAEQLLDQAIDIHQLNSDSLYVGYLQSRYLLIACNRYTGKVKNVLPLCESLLKDLRKTRDVKLLAGHLFFYSLCLFEAKQPTQALALLNEAEKLAENSNDIDIQRQALSEKASILSQIGNYKEAYEASKKSQELYAKMLSRDVAKAASDAEIKYQTKEKIRDLYMQKSLVAKEKKEKLFYLILAILIFILLVVFIWILRKNHSLKTEKLEKEKTEISLTKLLEGEELERTRLAKELHDGVVQDLTSLYLALNVLSNPNTTDFFVKKEELAKRIKETANEVRNLSHQMLPLTLNEKGLVLALEELFQRAFTPLALNYSFDVFSLDERLPTKLEMNVYRIAQELVNNCIKHSKASEIVVLLRKSEHKLIFIFEDNGIGMNRESDFTGIGIQNINSRVALLNGKIEFLNEAKGLYVKAEFPLI